jgi:arginine repressor
MKKIDDCVKNRLIKFLHKDKKGIRKSLLRLFSEAKSCTTVEIYDYLIKQGFNINYRAVSSMVGQMHSRLGILRFNLTNEHNVYTLKEDNLNIVNMVLTPFSRLDSISGTVTTIK